MSACPSAARCLWAAAADLADPVGPNGPPSNVQQNQYGDGKYYYTWTNYDASYGIQYSYDNGDTVEGNLPAGTTSKDTITAKPFFAVRHYQGAFYSEWAGWAA